MNPYHRFKECLQNSKAYQALWACYYNWLCERPAHFHKEIREWEAAVDQQTVLEAIQQYSPHSVPEHLLLEEHSFDAERTTIAWVQLWKRGAITVELRDGAFWFVAIV